MFLSILCVGNSVMRNAVVFLKEKKNLTRTGLAVTVKDAVLCLLTRIADRATFTSPCEELRKLGSDRVETTANDSCPRVIQMQHYPKNGLCPPGR